MQCTYHCISSTGYYSMLHKAGCKPCCQSGSSGLLETVEGANLIRLLKCLNLPSTKVDWVQLLVTCQVTYICKDISFVSVLCTLHCDVVLLQYSTPSILRGIFCMSSLALFDGYFIFLCPLSLMLYSFVTVSSSLFSFHVMFCE